MTRLVASNVSKQYGAVRALTDGNIEIEGGRVTALLGANGSGKSTLGKIITGLVRPDSGELTLDGERVTIRSPKDARRLGITAVYQELSLVPHMSVAHNIWLGQEPMRRGGIDQKEMRERSGELLELFSASFSTRVTPTMRVSDLTPGERQIIEILKAMAWRPRILILDEATASLDGRQVERLFELVAQWREEGMGLAFVSHRMEEIARVADRAVVLRNGDTVGEVDVATTSEAQLVQMMTGGATAPHTTRQRAASGEKLLEVEGLSSGRVRDINLSVAPGELVGIGGLQGQGQASLLLALFGAEPYRGTIRIAGKRVNLSTPRRAMREGVAYVPGDRGAEGLLPVRSILENLQLPSWHRYGLLLRQGKAQDDAMRAVDELNIKIGDIEDPVRTLSGGNAQKVVIGKWLLRKPRVLLLNDPTKGIDVGAKAEFYALLERLRDAGTAILFNSSDDEELLALCQKVIVLQDGQLRAVLEGEALTHENLVAASMGTAANGSAGRSADSGGRP